MQKVNPYAANYNTPRPTSFFGQAATAARPMYKPTSQFSSGMMGGVMPLMSSARSYLDRIKQPMSQPGRPMAPGLTVKDSGAPVNFAPQSMQTMTDVFGSPIQNSYDRKMSPMKQDMMMDDMSAQVDPITGMPFDETTY
jgi:hypothetical protein